MVLVGGEWESGSGFVMKARDWMGLSGHGEEVWVGYRGARQARAGRRVAPSNIGITRRRGSMIREVSSSLTVQSIEMFS